MSICTDLLGALWRQLKLVEGEVAIRDHRSELGARYILRRLLPAVLEPLEAKAGQIWQRVLQPPGQFCDQVAIEVCRDQRAQLVQTLDVFEPVVL